jgi:hypothetical protein
MADKYWPDPSEYSKRIDAYIAKFIDENGNFLPTIKTPPAINGIVRWLGFADKSTLYQDYRDSPDPEYSTPTKKAISLVEFWHEIHDGAMHIFAMKNMGWKDSQSFEHSGLPAIPAALQVELVEPRKNATE